MVDVISAVNTQKTQKQRKIHKKNADDLKHPRWISLQSALDQIQLTVSHWHDQGKCLNTFLFEYANLSIFCGFIKKLIHLSTPKCKKKQHQIPMSSKNPGQTTTPPKPEPEWFPYHHHLGWLRAVELKKLQPLPKCWRLPGIFQLEEPNARKLVQMTSGSKPEKTQQKAPKSSKIPQQQDLQNVKNPKYQDQFSRLFQTSFEKTGNEFTKLWPRCCWASIFRS